MFGIVISISCKRSVTNSALTTNADNNSKHLPEQYRFLLKK